MSLSALICAFLMLSADVCFFLTKNILLFDAGFIDTQGTVIVGCFDRWAIYLDKEHRNAVAACFKIIV